MWLYKNVSAESNWWLYGYLRISEERLKKERKIVINDLGLFDWFDKVH